MHIIPNLKSFQNAKDFFGEFYQLNQPNLSHRNFAAEINWPASLLGDMIQGRKKLTVNRAVEFGKYANLNSVEYEHLIMLSLKEVTNAGVQDYANSYLSTEGVVLNLDPTTEASTHHFISAEIFSNTELMALHAFLTWSKGHIDVQNIGRQLPAFPKLQDPGFVLSLLKRMNEEEIIEGSEPLVKILKQNLLAPKTTSQSQQAYLEVFKQIAALTPEKVTWRAGTVIFPNAKVPELHAKMNALTNWILVTAQHEEPTNQSALEEHTILQIDLSVFEILNHPKN